MSYKLVWLQLMPCTPDWMTMYHVVKVLVKKPMKLMILQMYICHQQRIPANASEQSCPDHVLLHPVCG